MQTHSNPKGHIGLIQLTLSEGSLDRDGAGERLARIRKDQHEAVALTLSPRIRRGRDLCPEDPVVRSQDLKPALVAEALGEDG
jgi:hypothetical protein